MFCCSCGKRIPDDSQFCENCGAQTEPIGAVHQQQPPLQPPLQQVAPSKKTPVGLIVGVAIVALVVVGAGGLFGARALFERNKQESVVELSAIDDADTEQIYEVEVGEEGILAEAPIIEEQPEVIAETAQPEVPIDTPAEQQNQFADYRGYVTGEIPSIGDFFWFTEDVKWDGLPPGRTTITDFNEIIGYWKAYKETIPMFQGDSRFLMWGNVEITGNEDQVNFTYLTENVIAFDEESSSDVDMSEWTDSSYLGSFRGGSLTFGDLEQYGIEVTIHEFYTLDGKQYAVGEESYISGEKSHIVLVRP